MKFTFSIPITLCSMVLFQCLFLSVYCQNFSEDQILPSDTPKTTPPVTPETTTFTPPTTTPKPPVIPRPPTTTPAVATTTLSTLHPPGSTINTVIVPSGVTTTPPLVLPSSARSSSSSVIVSRTAASSSSSTNSPITPSSSSSSAVSSVSILPTPSSTPKPDSQDATPTIVGAVVGGVVGIALIGGILACISRRGGCTKKRKDRKKKPDFEDYGLGDFPAQKPVPTTQKPAPMAQKPLSPTIPRLNEQGNYYQDNYQSYNYPQEEYGVHNQHQGGYYYPQLQNQYQHQPEYYNDGGYYYDHSAEATSPTMYSNSPMNQPYSPQGYAANNGAGYPSMYEHQSNSKPDDTTYRR